MRCAPPNTRMQRTRSSPSALRSPLMRCPLGARNSQLAARTGVVWSVVVMVACGRQDVSAARNVPTPSITLRAIPETLRLKDIPSPGPDVTPPMILKRVTAEIPEAVRSQRITQPLYLYRIAIDATGQVTDLEVIRGAGAEEPYRSIDLSFREAARKTIYRPATQDGKPIPYKLTISWTVEVR
jgi:hypothetical protein